MCRYALGIYYVGEQDHKFYDGKETKLIGCMTYGYPVGRSASQVYDTDIGKRTSIRVDTTIH